ncbi:Il-IS 2 transposase [Deinococcus marmoris]|uniref:Il-IS 2 transposase n=1 Tax=Deinococcus marmoris TaxID=249408 RepID=A0A1U7P4M7_9DEIO|nr:Il-IS 2 transposase [Deinococcus marmoris]
MIRFSRIEQHLADTPIYAAHVRLVIERQRYRCKSCGATSLEPLAWVHPDRQATRRLVEAIERDCLTLSNIQTAHMYGVDDKTVRNIQDNLVQRLERNAKFETPEWLGIDELYIGDTPRAVFTNIGDETLIEMLEDRSKATIITFLRTLDAPTVQAVTIDMWRPYRDAVREVLPHAAVIVDKWHVVRLANHALEQIRKSYRKGLDPAQRRRMRGNRYTLLKRRKTLTEKEVRDIENWRGEFPDLIAAYELKERFYGVYDASTALEARRRYARWLASVPESLRIKGGPWHELVTAMSNWEGEIMAYFEYRLTNAYTESMNRVIRDIDRSGRGHSFRVLRAKAIFGQEFRAKSKLASQSKRARRAFDEDAHQYLVHLGELSEWATTRREPSSDLMYGADLHLVAAYLHEQARRAHNRHGDYWQW